MIVFLRLSLIALAMLVFAAPARAHPHVWVTMHTELIYAPDGSITGVRHHWATASVYAGAALGHSGARAGRAIATDDTAG